MDHLLKRVRNLHVQMSFRERGGENLLFRMNLIMEEVGEISACLTKGRGDLAEEHADLMILVLGNCVAADIDIEEAVNRKLTRLESMEPIEHLPGHARLSTKKGK